jgi:hypothetical protein
MRVPSIVSAIVRVPSDAVTTPVPSEVIVTSPPTVRFLSSTTFSLYAASMLTLSLGFRAWTDSARTALVEGSV